MANYKVVDVDKLDADFQDIADAIREKTESNNTYETSEMGNAIREIEVGSTEVIPFRESDNGNPIRICAHRGYHNYTIENTAMSVLAALNMGFDFVECDIVKSQDGVYYVVHDITVKDIYNVTYNINSTESSVLDEILIAQPSNVDNFNKINVPTRMQRLSEVFEVAELIDRDFELWLELKNQTAEADHNAMISYLNENVSTSLRKKIRLFGGGINKTIINNKSWDKTLLFNEVATTIEEMHIIYNKCLTAKEHGIDMIVYLDCSTVNFDLANTYYENHSIETASYTFGSTAMFGALSKYTGIKYICADNTPNWSWQDFFKFKNENEFSNVETWDFASDAISDKGTTLTTSGTFTYDNGVKFETNNSYMWLNLPFDSKMDGMAEFEVEWTPGSTNQRITHIGGHSESHGLISSGNQKRLGFYSLADKKWFYPEYPLVSSEIETHTVRVYWNTYSYIVYVDGKVYGSHFIGFNTATTNAGRNFCLGSNSTGFTGTIRNLVMKY